MPLLEGQTAVVTGGAQGIGFAIAERYVAEGARVVLGDLDLDATVAAVEKLGGRDVAAAVRCDVTSAAEVEALIAAAVEKFGSLDVMVNNAGITRDATMRKMTEEQFDQVISVHLKGTWNGTRKAADIMRENKRGAIVNISSISGKVGLIGQTNYSAAKAGIVGLTKAAAKEVAHLGVRINAIQPGLIRSAMTEAMPQRIWDAKLAEIPMARAGEPDDDERDRVPESPHRTEQHALPRAVRFGDQRRDRGQMIGLERVAQTDENSEHDTERGRRHARTLSRIFARDDVVADRHDPRHRRDDRTVERPRWVRDRDREREELRDRRDLAEPVRLQRRMVFANRQVDREQR